MFLTEKQLAVLTFIRDFIRDKGLSPTLDEMAQFFGVSKITIHEHVNALEKKGALTKTRNMARSIALVEPGDGARPREILVRGRIAAGAAIEAIEESETFKLDDLAPPGDDCYMLHVEGDSMIDAHICPGDLVLVKPATTARNGEIVVAMLPDDQTGSLKGTIKRFYREGDGIRLQPANARLKPILVKDVAIQGRVVGVVRPRV